MRSISISISNPVGPELFAHASPPSRFPHRLLTFCPPLSPSLPSRGRRRRPPMPPPKSFSASAKLSTAEAGWLKKLPDKKKPLYSHSLPCIEAWLKSLGFCQSREDKATWFVEKPDWHAHLSLDVTDLFIRYLKTGPGDLEKDVERRFSYALSREDIENAILGGP
uniref:Valine--tRNA ligase n=1 Tax=Anthurium amnicola TaxID=1678845 RepID=A0A1D1YME0_9ARAE